MRSIINVARLYITLVLNDRSIYIQLFVVPIILMVVLSAAIRDEQVRLRLDVVDQDNSELSAELIQQIKENGELTDTLIVCVYGEENEDCDLKADDDFEDVGEDRVKEGETSAALIIPAGFGEALQNGQPLELTYQSNDQLNAPTVTRTAVQTALSQISNSLTIAQIGTATAAEYFGTDPQADFATLRDQAQAALQTPPITVAKVSSGEEEAIGLGVNQSVPGISAMFVLFSSLALASVLVTERENWTLQRLFTIPTRPFNIILGKVLGAYIFSVIQFAVFVIVGGFLGVDWGTNYLAIALLVLSYCLAGTALGLALGTVVRTSAQALAMMNLIGLTLAPLGGAWWPLEIVPETMQTIGHISPIAWLMEGFGELIYYNGGIAEILPKVGALLLMAGVLIVFAIWRFRYE